ncbi:MAG TPA: S9 family peptidase [Ktedonobacterales bacterium]|nr:S9 family peptidase [Ktedonobacterales bacterium]
MTTTRTELSENATRLEPARVPATPANLRQARLPDDEDIHPDGSRVAFVLRDWAADQPKPVARIWTVGLDGSKPVALTAGPGNDTHPRWSPDGQQLALLSTRDGEQEEARAQLYLMPASGGTPRRLCALPNGVESFAWSPDGSQLALLTLEGDEPAKDPIVVTPDRHRRLWTVSANGDQPAPVTPAGATIWEYTWSPDGQQFAVYYTFGPGETDWYRGQVGIVPAEGGAIRRLTDLTRQVAALAWSPDGQRIGYISGEWSDRGLVGGEVFVIAAAGGEPRNLTPGVEFSPSWLRWFADGKRMLYTGWDGVAHQIGLLDEASGERTPLTRDFIIGGGGWPRLSATPDLRAFATHSSDRLHPPDVYTATLATDDRGNARLDWRQVTRLNALLEETVQLAPAEVVTWESVDGWRIDGLFSRPTSATGDGPPPLVVQVHGGPSAAWQTDWRGGLFWGQICASAGYAVFQPNIRGGVGRGIAFADAVLGDPGGKDLADVLSGIDMLVERGLVDGARVAIVGWSYGGFMTAWAISQSNRFKAAMMGAGVCDFHSFHAQTNIADWDMRILTADPLANPGVYRDRSAITYAAQITTPTLIVHGEQDPCVPVNQAYEFHRALLERNVPTELVVYPREGHGFQERDHVLDVDTRMLRWMARYL